MGEALSLRYEDAKLKRDAGNTFYVFHLRVTKTDPFCKRMECLNLTLSTPHSIPLAEVIKGMFDNNKRGKRIYEKASNNAYNRPPIPGAEGRHQRSHGLHQAIRQKGRNRKRGKNEIKEDINNFPQKISAHSGRVFFYVEGRRGGQTQAELAHTLRWMPGSAMPDYYERIYRETLPTGAPTVVAEMRLKKRTSTASNPTSNQVNGELSKLK